MNKKEPLTGKITNAKIFIYFSTSTLITLNINYVAGFVKVNGEAFKRWIGEEFPNVESEFKAIGASLDEIIYNTMAPTEKIDSNEDIKPHDDMKLPTNKELQSESDIIVLWEKYTELHTAAEATDTALNKLTQNYLSLESNYNKDNSTVENMIKHTEATYDSKLTIYLLTLYINT